MSERCCLKKAEYEVVFDVGSLGERTYLICSYHINRKPFNKHIKSQIKIGESIA